MATYYRWEKRNAIYSEVTYTKTVQGGRGEDYNAGYIFNSKPTWTGTEYSTNGGTLVSIGNTSIYGKYAMIPAFSTSICWYGVSQDSIISFWYDSDNIGSLSVSGDELRGYAYQYSAGSLIGYVYNLNSNAYPTDGRSADGYWYSNRITVTSPTQPTGLTYPNPITTQKVTVSWQAATSNVPDYPVSGYQVDVSTNGGTSWTLAGNPNTNSLTYSITPSVTSIMFRVRAKDSNGQWGSYVTGTASQVLLVPTLTVPQQLMRGQQATINWTAITGADSYTLQRKANTDTDWTQVYSGANTTFSEVAGTWTTVQYRVQAVFDGTPGGWATSAEIPVVSASALVISGQDGDLGTLVNDVPYSISTDTGNQITATITANGAVIFSGNVGNSTADVIPVLDLINGSGTIVIEASVTASSGPVSAVRTWTYTKTMMTFPNAGSIAELTKDGKVMWPETLAEAVRIPGGKTLDQVMGFPCQIYTGSYVGTGTYGQANPNSLTFPFEPKAVLIAKLGPNSPMLGIFIQNVFYSMVVNNNIRNMEHTSISGNTITWYSTGSDTVQLNEEDITYPYVVFG